MERAEFRRQVWEELVGNILPFWMARAVDKENGGFYGALTNDLQVHNHVPRAATFCARLLWSYAAAYRRLGIGASVYGDMARRAYGYLVDAFWDEVHGGLYWEVAYDGRVVSERKQHLAQAYGIYGLSEYYRATGERRSLALAQELFHLLEAHAFDAAHGGYWEGSSRRWMTLNDAPLDEADPHCQKTLNTTLHVLEAYSNLLRVWDEERLQRRHRALLETFLERVVDGQRGHLWLFFDEQWDPLAETVSYGHDIEASWLLWEAAQFHDDPELTRRAGDVAVALARAVCDEGVDEDGGVRSEDGDTGGKAWWPQAEGMVGFYNAYQLTGRNEFARAARRCWAFIQEHLVDREYGEWYKQVDRAGQPDAQRYKAGPWDDPYHQCRACLEMMERLRGTESSVTS